MAGRCFLSSVSLTPPPTSATLNLSRVAAPDLAAPAHPRLLIPAGLGVGWFRRPLLPGPELDWQSLQHSSHHSLPRTLGSLGTQEVTGVGNAPTPLGCSGLQGPWGITPVLMRPGWLYPPLAAEELFLLFSIPPADAQGLVSMVIPSFSEGY